MSGGSPSVSPTSPNWRSRSIRITRWPRWASTTARFVDVSVLPVPPFGPSTATIRALSCPDAAFEPRRRCTVLWIAKRTCSPDWGSGRMSSAPSSKILRTKPAGEPSARMITGRSGSSRTARSTRNTARSEKPRQAITTMSSCWVSSAAAARSRPGTTLSSRIASSPERRRTKSSASSPSSTASRVLIGWATGYLSELMEAVLGAVGFAPACGRSTK